VELAKECDQDSSLKMLIRYYRLVMFILLMPPATVELNKAKKFKWISMDLMLFGFFDVNALPL